MEEMAVINGILEGWNARDSKKIGAGYAPDAQITAYGLGPTSGRVAIEENAVRIFDASKDVRVWAWRVWKRSDIGAVEWGFSGTYTGAAGGVNPSERPITGAGASLLWFDQNGLVRKENRYLDVYGVMAQFGAAYRGLPPGFAVPPWVGAPETHIAKDDKADASVPISLFLAAMESGNIANLVSLFANDVIWYDGFIHLWVNAENLVAGFKRGAMFMAAFPGMKFKVTTRFSVGDAGIIASTMEGIHQGAFGIENGPFGVLQATGKSVKFHRLDLGRSKNGKVISGGSYFNVSELVAQVGVEVPPMPI